MIKQKKFFINTIHFTNPSETVYSVELRHEHALMFVKI